MKNKPVIMVVSIFLLLFMFSCTPAPAPTTQTPVQTPTQATAPKPAQTSAPAPAAFKWPSEISIITTGTGSTPHVTASAWGAVLEKTQGPKVRIVPEDNSVSIDIQIKGGKFDMWQAGHTVWVDAMEARVGFATKEAGPAPVSAVWLGGNSYLPYYVRGDSAIKTWADLKAGYSYAVWMGSPTFVTQYHALRAWLNLSEQEFRAANFGSMEASMKAPYEGKADITYISANSPYMYEAVAGPKGVRIIDVPLQDLEGMKRFRNVAPEWLFGTVPKGHGPEIGWGHTSMFNPHLIMARTDLPVDLVYNLAKWLDENYKAYVSDAGLLRDMTREQWRMYLNQIEHPVHEGTIKYMKEIGLWTAADSTRQEYNSKLQKWYTLAFKSAVSAAEAKGIGVNPANKDWVAFWAQSKKDLGIPRTEILRDEEITARLPVVTKGLSSMP